MKEQSRTSKPSSFVFRCSNIQARLCGVGKKIRGDRKSKKARTEREKPNEDGWEDHMTLGEHCVCVLGQVEWEVLMEKQYGRLFKLAAKRSFCFNF